MSRSNFFFGVFFLLLLVTIGCGTMTGNIPLPFSHQEQFERIVSTNSDYTLYIPSCWKGNEKISADQLTFISPDKKDKSNHFNEQLSITHINVNPLVHNVANNEGSKKGVLNLNDFASFQLSKLQKNKAEFKMLERGETILNGYHAKRYVYSYSDQNEYAGTLKAIIFFVEREGQYYVINGVDAKEDFIDARELFDKVVHSFHFI